MLGGAATSPVQSSNVQAHVALMSTIRAPTCEEGSRNNGNYKPRQSKARNLFGPSSNTYIKNVKCPLKSA